MKLLFHENLSPRLVEILSTYYPGSAHVRDIGMRGTADDRIWTFAQEHGFAIVSKNTDVRQRSFSEGAPPKVIWLNVANAGSEDIASLLQRERSRIERFN